MGVRRTADQDVYVNGCVRLQIARYSPMVDAREVPRHSCVSTSIQRKLINTEGVRVKDALQMRGPLGTFDVGEREQSLFVGWKHIFRHRSYLGVWQREKPGYGLGCDKQRTFAGDSLAGCDVCSRDHGESHALDRCDLVHGR